MQNDSTWLSGPEAADHLAIRHSRLAQCLRAGLLPYRTGVDYVLVHVKHIRKFTLLYPDLLDYFRAENEVDKHVEDGELVFEIINFPPPNTVKLLKCVEAREGSFPTRELPQSRVRNAHVFSP